MIRIIFNVVLWNLLFSLNLESQTVADFESYNLSLDTFLNGSDGSGGFSSGSIFLPNSYDTEFEFWSGWSISTMRDDSTPGFINQHSAIPGTGADGTDHYAVSFSSQPNIARLMPASQTVQGLYVTNSTYAYLSMRDGDAFAKKFGGADGSDPDFFLVTIKYYRDGMLSTDSIDFFLADFRFEDSKDDYLLDQWEFIDLTHFGEIDSLWFSLSSSDVGQFGMNTPAYFCVDQIITGGQTTALHSVDGSAIHIFPNPTKQIIQIDGLPHDDSPYAIYNIAGQMIQHGSVSTDQKVDLSSIRPGTYYLQLQTNGKETIRPVIRK